MIQRLMTEYKRRARIKNALWLLETARDHYRLELISAHGLAPETVIDLKQKIADIDVRISELK